MQLVFLAYLIFSFGVLILQVFGQDFFMQCQFSTDTCGRMMVEYTINAALWPKYLFP